MSRVTPLDNLVKKLVDNGNKVSDNYNANMASPKGRRRYTTMNNYKGFYKVTEEGGTYVVSYFYNPETNEYFSACTRDYDYADGSRDNDELYYMPIDKEVRRVYLRHLGNILIGDKIIIFKGRKMLGEVKTVADEREYIPPHCEGWSNRHAYAVWYFQFTDGTSVAQKNCKALVELEYPKRVDMPE